jgi:hypothetical protein
MASHCSHSVNRLVVSESLAQACLWDGALERMALASPGEGSGEVTSGQVPERQERGTVSDTGGGEQEEGEE